MEIYGNGDFDALSPVQTFFPALLMQGNHSQLLLPTAPGRTELLPIGWNHLTQIIGWQPGAWIPSTSHLFDEGRTDQTKCCQALNQLEIDALLPPPLPPRPLPQCLHHLGATHLLTTDIFFLYPMPMPVLFLFRAAAPWHWQQHWPSGACRQLLML